MFYSAAGFIKDCFSCL